MLWLNAFSIGSHIYFKCSDQIITKHIFMVLTKKAIHPVSGLVYPHISYPKPIPNQHVLYVLAVNLQ